MQDVLSLLMAIEARDLASTTIRGIRSEMGGLIQSLGDAAAKADAVVSNWSTLSAKHLEAAGSARQLADAYAAMGQGMLATNLDQEAARLTLLSEAEARVGEGAVSGATGWDRLGASIAAAAPAIATVTVASGLAAAAVAGIGAAATKMAADYQTTMVQVQNNTGSSNADMQAMDATIQKLGADSGTPLKNLADAYRQVHDFGFDAAQSTQILSVANQAAVATGADVSTVARVVAQRLNEWNLGAGDATAVTNELMVASQGANATMEQYAASQGKAAAMAAAMGQPMNELDASTVALTRHGFDLATAQTQIANEFKTALAPTTAQHKEIVALGNALGIDLLADFTKATNGQERWSEVLAKVKDATHGNAQELAQLSTGIRSLPGLMALLNGGWEDYQKELIATSDAYSGKITPVQDGYARSLQTLGVEMARIKVSIQEVGIALGDALMPAFKGLLDQVLPNITALAEWMRTNADAVAHALELAFAITAVIAAIGGLTLLFTAFAAAAAFISPPMVIAAAIIVGLGVAIVELATHFQEIEAAVNGFAAAIGGQFSALGSNVSNAIASIQSGLNQLASIFQRALQAVLDTINAFIGPISQALSWLDPTVAHSPSLVDNAQRGVAAILGSYSQFNQIPGLISGADEAVKAFTITLQKFYDGVNKVAEQKAAKAIGEVGGDVTAYYAAIAAVKSLSDAKDQLNSTLDTESAKLKTLKDDLDAATAAYKAQQDVVTADQNTLSDFQNQLSAQTQVMQGLLSSYITGEGAARNAAADLKDQVQNQQSAIDALKASQDAQIQSLQNTFDATQTAYQAAQDQVAALNATMQDTKNQIDQAKSALNDLLSSNLPGTADYNNAKFTLEEQVKQAQLNVVNAEMSGGGKNTAQVTQLNQVLAQLQLQVQQLDLQHQLNTDPLVKQLNDLAKPIKEVPFDTLKDGIIAAQKTITDLTPTLQTQTNAWNDAKVKQDAAKASMDTASAALDRQKKANQEALAPLQAHLTALQGQAAAADAVVRSYDTMHRHLQNASKDVKEFSFADLLQQIETTKHNIEGLQGKVDLWKDKTNDAKKALETLNQKMQADQGIYDTQKKKVDGLTEAYNELSKMIQDANKQIKDAGTAAEQKVAGDKAGAKGGGGPITGGEGPQMPPPPALDWLSNRNINQGPLNPTGLQKSFDSIKEHVSNTVNFVKQHWQEMLAGLAFLPINILAAPWIALGTLIKAHWGGISDTAKRIFGPGGDIGSFFSGLGSFALATFGPGGSIGQAFDGFGTQMQHVFGPGGVIGSAFNQFGTTLNEVVTGVQTFVKNVATGFGNLFDNLGFTIHQAIAPILAAWGAMFSSLGTALNTWTQNSLRFWGQFFSDLGTAASTGWTTVQGLFSRAWDWLTTHLALFWTGFTTFFGHKFSELGTNVNTWWNGIETFYGNAFNLLGTALQTYWTTALTFWGTKFSELGTLVTTLWGTFIDTVWTPFTDKLKSVMAEAWKTITDALPGIWVQITAAIDTGVKAALKVFQPLMDFVGNLLSALGKIPGAIANAASHPSPGGGGGTPEQTKQFINSAGFPTDSSSNGGVANASNPQFMQGGGLVTRPTLAIVGEAGPELVIPLSHLAQVEGGGTTVVININNPQLWATKDINWMVEQIGRAMAQRGLPAAGMYSQYR